ncbi:dTDP-glucose pyrophosphorylase [Clostridium sp. CAG:914]|nr:dTDP-glucose pyrophosphorylase [Clostridium sp. CAG:914]
MTLVILAAGMGSRFGGLKQIEPIDEYGHFIIDYSIYDAIREGFTKVVFIIKRENYDIFRETIGKRIEKKIEVEYVFQEIDNLPEGYSVPEGRIKPWGTAHAILCAKDKVDENFAIINADDFYGRDAYHVISKFMKNNNTHDNILRYAMAGYKVKNTLTENGSVKRGVCEEENGYLTNIIECKVEKVDSEIIATPLEGGNSFKVLEDAPVSMNMFAFTKDIFEYLEEGFPLFLDKHKEDIDTCEYLIPSVVFEEIENKIATVEVLKTNAIWQGITYKEDKEKVVKEIKKLVDNNEYPKDLWK